MVFTNLRKAFNQRFGIEQIKRNFLYRRLPKTSWYQGDGAAIALLFGVQVLTGICMALGYTNSPDEAYESVQRITNEWVLGWLVRSLHYWSAGMMVIALTIHVFRHLLLGGYKAPREGIWTVGVFLFFLVLTMSYTGYTLRWDERAIYAIRVLLNMLYNVPIIGEELVVFVQGGMEIGADTLSRFFSLHVIIIPLLMGALIAYHIYLVVVNGVTSKVERTRQIKTAKEQKELYHAEAETKKGGEWFYPKTMLNSGLTGFIFFLIALGLAVFLGPAPLYPKANLTETSYPIEEWWFHWYSSLIAILPPAIVPAFTVGFPIILFLFMITLPFLDRGANRGIQRRPIWAVAVALMAISLLSLTALRLQSPWTGWPSSKPVSIPKGVELTKQSRIGSELFVSYGCNSCHAIAGDGPEVGPDLAKVESRLSRAEIRRFMLNPPAGIPMPSYEGRLTEKEVEYIMEFVHVAQTFPFEQKEGAD